MKNEPEVSIDNAGNVSEKPAPSKSKSNRKPGTVYCFNGAFFMEMPGNQFKELDVNSIKRHLTYNGMDTEEMSNGLKNWERVITIAQLEREVHYAGPLSGHQAGLKKLPSGEMLLVTRGFQLAGANNQVDFPFLEKFVDQLLGAEQTRYFMLWLKFARQTLREGSFRPGQFVVFCGPAMCGKSLIQTIITHCLTGRFADPWRYMQDKTPFNSDLCESEHLCCEDKAGSFDIRRRIAFGEAIKDVSAVSATSVHAKGKSAFTVNVFKRGTFSMNDEAEQVMVLPPIGSSLRDKLMLFKCSPAEVWEDKVKVWKTIMKELPGFLHAVDQWPLDRGLSNSRYGVKEFLHPQLLDMLETFSPEQRLDDIICDVIFLDTNVKVWTGTSERLENILRDSSMNFAIQSLATFPTWCGTYLARLRTKFPLRYTSRRVNNRMEWTISKIENKELL